ncbi:hypothetical protein QZH41_008600 [Actinostola sp. cb2023]|nr:hypothetical protein QZH41_008600 [Actinostola sp. cb2023]
MVLRREYSAETRELINQKGFSCICELCDCGMYNKFNCRHCFSHYHRHEGCTRNVHKIQQVFKHPGMGQVATDYQCSYKQHDNSHPRHLLRPLPKIRNPHPPPMDFRTEQRMEFIKREMPGTKSCKMVGSYERSGEKMDSLTVYNREFIDHGPPTVPKVTRPKTVIAPNLSKFHDQTTHNTTFTHKVLVPQVMYGELPSFTHSILFPDPKTDVTTTNQDVYKGKYAKVAELCKPVQAQVSIGIEGEFSHGTTHRDAFKTPEREGRQEPRKRISPLKPDVRAKFQSQTQFKSDFPGYGGKMPKPTKLIPPPPETVKLAMNNNIDFHTTNEQFFKLTWDPKTIGRTAMIKPDGGTYKTPQTKMETVTQSMRDYTQKESVKQQDVRPPTRIERNQTKFRDETVYNSQFKHYGTVPFKRYGDIHESAYYLKPVTKFYQDGSVTKQDFQGALGGKPRTPHKPVSTLHNDEGELFSQTTYGSTYVKQPQQSCSYLKWVRERETKKAAEKIILRQKSEPPKVFNETAVKSGILCGK